MIHLFVPHTTYNMLEAIYYILVSWLEGFEIQADALWTNPGENTDTCRTLLLNYNPSFRPTPHTTCWKQFSIF